MHYLIGEAAVDLMTSLKPGRRAGSFAMVGLVALLASCTLQPEARAVSAVAGANSAKTTDIAAKRQQSSLTQVASAETDNVKVLLQPSSDVVGYYGHGPYICSPSGFGHRSQCVPRM